MNRPSGYEACTGCGVCLLSCPVWRAEGDPFMTVCGRARALQGGASAPEIRASVSSCLLCGACRAVCPSGIDTVGLTLGLRAGINMQALSPVSPKTDAAGKTVLLPGIPLRMDQDRLAGVIRCLGEVELPETGADRICDSLIKGLPVEGNLLKEFAGRLSGARLVIAVDGLLHTLITALVPGAGVMGLGEALLRNPAAASALGPGDLYVIEPRGFHADYSRLIHLYDDLRRKTQCQLNLDLQRAAIGTFGSWLQSGQGRNGVDAVSQARWILEGKNVTRIVVESVEDIRPFRKASSLPVFHLPEIMQV